MVRYPRRCPWVGAGHCSSPRRHGSPNAGRRGPACRRLDKAVGGDGLDGAHAQITAHHRSRVCRRGSTRDGFLALTGTSTEMALRQRRQVASDTEAERIPFRSIDATPVCPATTVSPSPAPMVRWWAQPAVRVGKGEGPDEQSQQRGRARYRPRPLSPDRIMWAWLPRSSGRIAKGAPRSMGAVTSTSWLNLARVPAPSAPNCQEHHPRRSPSRFTWRIPRASS